ncbi:hypothetical protein J3R82DRAFT_10066 [Butyriboletus roseoflavus]|nr:hypothetical protein J3R82DRAFT_10066 [Butyriboletus roseoflavus]
MQTQKTEEDLHVLLLNNPFIPPRGDVCFINNLPPELLLRIFEVGTADNDIDSEDEGNMAAYSDYVRYYRLDAKDADDSDIPHGVKMTEERAR